jgi:hypothetical protein
MSLRELNAAFIRKGRYVWRGRAHLLDPAVVIIMSWLVISFTRFVLFRMPALKDGCQCCI